MSAVKGRFCPGFPPVEPRMPHWVSVTRLVLRTEYGPSRRPCLAFYITGCAELNDSVHSYLFSHKHS